jgi:hypothetical protein
MMTCYTSTNEKLNAIVLGLGVEPKDYILTIGSSGDQAFAFLETARKVLAVDVEEDQCNYIRKQMKSLADEDYVTFLERRLNAVCYGDVLDEDGKLRDPVTRYFNRKRLEIIRKRLPRLKIKRAEILDTCRKKRGFNKIYLSNSLMGHPDELRPKLQIVSNSIPVGGLVYASNGETISESLDGSGFALDERLTSLIEDRNWHPIVLRKV